MVLCVFWCVFVRLQVRSRAQNVLTIAMGTFSFSYRDMMPRIIQLLSPQHTAGTQQQFKVPDMPSMGGGMVV